jgi:hypothetical protein
LGLTITMPITVRYYFSQHFPVYAQKAFEWCTDFDQKDHKLMGDKNAERQVTRVADGVLVLKDTFHTAAGTVEKQKLVQLYPDKHTWASTHLTGPNKYSQFLYQITPQGKGACVLNFTALHLEPDEKVNAKVLAAHLCKEDSAAWKLLAKAMAEEQNK